MLKTLPETEETVDAFYDCVMAATGGDTETAERLGYERLLRIRRAAVAKHLRANG